MKLARFTDGGPPEIGIVTDDGLVSLSRAAPQFNDDMNRLIADWPGFEAEAQRIAAERGHLIPRRGARLLAPVSRPGKVMAIGLNYADHIAEANAQRPERQMWFAKAQTSINAPFDPIEIPAEDSAVDYEAELVAVVGTGGRRLSASESRAAIFGYCVGNDVSERNWQLRSPQWTLGKSFDTHGPIGPWITTSDEVGDPHALDIRCFVNGERRQNSNTANLVFDIWDQVEHLSQAMTLEAGDLIFTGTPGGIGAAMTPRRYLAAGDQVRVEIDRLGEIEATCRLAST